MSHVVTMTLFPRICLFTVALALLAAAGIGLPASAAGVDGGKSGLKTAPSDSLAGPRAASFWGEIPAPSDSVTAAFKNRSRSAWEWPLYIPYAAINYPLRWIREGIGKGVIWADRKDLFHYIHIIPIPKGVVPSVAYSKQSGFGVGADVYLRLASPRNPLRLRGKYSTERWQKYTVGSILNKGGKWELHLGGGYRLRPNLEYYGIGPNTSADDAAFYTDERAWGGLNFRRRLHRNMYLAFTSVYSGIDARQPGSGYEPTILDVYGDDPPPGFGQSSNGVMMRVSWVLNTAKEEGNPNHGTLLGVSIGGFVATNTNDVSFTAYRLEIQQFVPLWYSKRSLALRGYLNFIDDTGTAEIPFQRMFINEAPDMFRGFDTGRWRDLGITGINVEYRYPFVADRTDGGFGIDVVALADIGQVFSEISEVKVGNLTQSYGVGLRAYMNKYFAGAMEFVWSDEGFQFRLSTKQMFQYSRDVLFQGREETLIH
jgi:hypothetical protein